MRSFLVGFRDLLHDLLVGIAVLVPHRCTCGRGGVP